jgi:hypothetical protein
VLGGVADPRKLFDRATEVNSCEERQSLAEGPRAPICSRDPEDDKVIRWPQQFRHTNGIPRRYAGRWVSGRGGVDMCGPGWDAEFKPNRARDLTRPEIPKPNLMLSRLGTVKVTMKQGAQASDGPVVPDGEAKPSRRSQRQASLGIRRDLSDIYARYAPGAFRLAVLLTGDPHVR